MGTPKKVAPQLTVVDNICSILPHNLADLRDFHPTISLESVQIMGLHSIEVSFLS
jgi:hypothetical protein